MDNDVDPITCDQCNVSYNATKTKPIYEEDGAVCGRICDYCRLENVQNARRCQLRKCQLTADRIPSLKIIPAKFYDLPDGKGKQDIIVQFGMTRDTKACCNTCYLRISRAVQKAKIFSACANTSLEKEEKEKDESYRKSANNFAEKYVSVDANYSGPQFRRKEGLIPFWLRQTHQPDRKVTNSNPSPKETKNLKSTTSDILRSVNKRKYTPQYVHVDDTFYDEKEDDESEIDSSRDDTYQPPADCHINRSTSPPKTRSRTVKKPTRYAEDISDFILVDDEEEGEEYNQATVTPSTKDEISATPVEVKADETDVSEGTEKAVMMSEVLPCQACNKMFNGALDQRSSHQIACQLCDDCLPRKSVMKEKRCRVRGCTTEVEKEKLKVLPAGYFSLIRIHKKALSLKFGLKRFIKTCCENCFTLIKEAVKDCREIPNASYTICRTCQRIIPESSIVKFRDANGVVTKVGCDSCCDRPNRNNKNGESKFKKIELLKFHNKTEHDYKTSTSTSSAVLTKTTSCTPILPNLGELPLTHFLKNFDKTRKEITGILGSIKLGNMTRYNICAVNGCVWQGKTTWVYSYTPILKCCTTSVENELIRVFHLMEGRDGCCCRSCFSEIKWYAAYLSDHIKHKTDNEVTNVQVRKKNALILPKPTGSVLIPVSLATTQSSDLKYTANATITLPTTLTFHQQKSSLVSTQQSTVPQIQLSNVHSVKTQQTTPANLVKILPLQQEVSVASPATVSSPIYPVVASVFSLKPASQKSIITHATMSQQRNAANIVLSYPVNANSTIPQMQVLTTHSKHITSNTQNPMFLATTPVKSGMDYQKSDHINSSSTNINREADNQYQIAAVKSDAAHRRHVSTTNKCQVVTVRDNTTQHETSRPLNMFYNKATLTNAPQLKLDKVCQTGLVYMSDSRDKCSSTILKRPYDEISDTKLKRAVRKEAKDMFNTFLNKLDTLTLGCGVRLLAEFTHPKEVTHTQNFMTMLEDYGALYKRTRRHNKQERLRLLSSVAAYASNDMLRNHFQHYSAKGDLVSVNEDEIKRARDYAKLFGPGFPLPAVKKGGHISSSCTSSASLSSSTAYSLASSCTSSSLTNVTPPLWLMKDSKSSLKVGSRLKDSSNRTVEEVILIEDENKQISSPVPANETVSSPAPANPNVEVHEILSNNPRSQPSYIHSTASERQMTTADKIMSTSNIESADNVRVYPHLKQFLGLPGYFVTTRSKIWTTNTKESDIVKELSTREECDIESFDEEGISTSVDCHIHENRPLSPTFDLATALNVSSATTGTIYSAGVLTQFGSGQRFMHANNDKYDETVGGAPPSQPDVMKSGQNTDLQNNSSGASKLKRKRTKFTVDEREQLEGYYLERVLHGKKRKIAEIQSQLNMDGKTIRTWFRNRGFKARKDMFKQSLKEASFHVSSEAARKRVEMSELSSQDEARRRCELLSPCGNEQDSDFSDDLSCESFESEQSGNRTSLPSYMPRSSIDMPCTTVAAGSDRIYSCFLSSQPSSDLIDTSVDKKEKTLKFRSSFKIGNKSGEFHHLCDTNLTALKTLPELEHAFHSVVKDEHSAAFNHLHNEPPILTPSPDIFHEENRSYANLPDLIPPQLEMRIANEKETIQTDVGSAADQVVNSRLHP